jgi:hypothetical protein
MYTYKISLIYSTIFQDLKNDAQESCVPFG